MSQRIGIVVDNDEHHFKILYYDESEPTAFSDESNESDASDASAETSQTNNSSRKERLVYMKLIHDPSKYVPMEFNLDSFLAEFKEMDIKYEQMVEILANPQVLIPQFGKSLFSSNSEWDVVVTDRIDPKIGILIQYVIAALVVQMVETYERNNRHPLDKDEIIRIFRRHCNSDELHEQVIERINEVFNGDHNHDNTACVKTFIKYHCPRMFYIKQGKAYKRISAHLVDEHSIINNMFNELLHMTRVDEDGVEEYVLEHSDRSAIYRSQYWLFHYFNNARYTSDIQALMSVCEDITNISEDIEWFIEQIKRQQQEIECLKKQLNDRKTSADP